MGRKRKLNYKSFLDEAELLSSLETKTEFGLDHSRVNDTVARILDQVAFHARRGLDIQKTDIKNVVTGVPKSVYSILEHQEWKFLTSKVVECSESSNGTTTKLLIELEDEYQVECVILRHNKRTTLCVSSQAGCKMACTFCATGALGYEANLTSGEILQQLAHAQMHLLKSKSDLDNKRSITNIVFMGMGEPLNNYSNVVSACKSMVMQKRFNLSPGRITVSTVGVVNRMRSLHKDLPGINLALSLHAPNQELRQRIIPTASAYPIQKLIDVLKGHLHDRESTFTKSQFVMIEYILLAGVNDMEEIARELAMLLIPLKDQVKVNLIPYNPIFNPQGLAQTFSAPSEVSISKFKNILYKEFGIFCTVRTEMGQDVNGACGQLACIAEKKKKANVDIEDICGTMGGNKKERTWYKPQHLISNEAVERKTTTSGSEYIYVAIALAGIAAIGSILVAFRKKL